MHPPIINTRLHIGARCFTWHLPNRGEKKLFAINKVHLRSRAYQPPPSQHKAADSFFLIIATPDKKWMLWNISRYWCWKGNPRQPWRISADVYTSEPISYTAGQPLVFVVELVGLTAETLVGWKSYTVHADKLLTDVRKTDLIIIPAVDGYLETAIDVLKKATSNTPVEYIKRVKMKAAKKHFENSGINVNGWCTK